MTKPLFIKIDEYDELKDTIRLIKGKVNEARSILDKISQLKHEEESELDVWRNELDNVDKKIGLISETLSPAE